MFWESYTIRAHYLDDSGQVYYTIINPGSAYFGGDDYHFKVQIEDNASLLLTGQSATKIYKTPENYSLQDFDVELRHGAVFEYIPDQLIAYEDAIYAQYMNVKMDPTASLLTVEIITPGWAPDGSLFRFDEVRMRTAVQGGENLTVVDNLPMPP
ncbi:MAG: urease accessory protein UreD [Corynebacterium sp.]|nr:urease accessory protein UreD [Corynebacterium sp.]